MLNKIKFIERIGTIAIFSLSIIFVSILVIAQWPMWWKWIIFEQTPMTWFESLLLYTCSIIAFECACIVFLTDTTKRQTLVWSLLGSAFLYLSMDERFAIHERIRDKILAPHDITIPLFFWVSPGDYLLLLMLILGLVVLPLVLKLFQVNKIAKHLFLTGIFITSLSVIIDSFDVKNMSIEFQRLEQFIEEMIETLGMLFFLNSFFLMFTSYLRIAFHPEGKIDLRDY